MGLICLNYVRGKRVIIFYSNLFFSMEIFWLRLCNGSRNLMECGRSSESIQVFKIGICCFYLQLFVGKHMSYLCYLWLLTC